MTLSAFVFAYIKNIKKKEIVNDFVFYKIYDRLLKMFTYKNFSSIAPEGISVLDNAGFNNQDTDYDALLLRSHKISSKDFGDKLKCIGRAGAGFDHIPVNDASEKGIVVFNTPGANANAVKELVICGLLLSSRGVVEGSTFSSSLQETSSDDDLNNVLESEKKQFIGNEIFGKTLGIVGLGSIGSLVAYAAKSLGMNLVGYDPYISIDSAWRLPGDVEKAPDLKTLIKKSDYISLHVPLSEETQGLFSTSEFKYFKEDSKLINLSRGGIVDNDALIKALEEGLLKKYVTDFPTQALINRAQNSNDVILLPHLGASTKEAKINCAVMAANQIKDYLLNGNIINSVNFPSIILDRSTGYRLIVINKNEPGMISKIADQIAEEKFNIEDMSNKSREDLAINLIDLNKPISESLLSKLSNTDNIISVRALEH